MRVGARWSDMVILAVTLCGEICRHLNSLRSRALMALFHKDRWQCCKCGCLEIGQDHKTTRPWQAQVSKHAQTCANDAIRRSAASRQACLTPSHAMFQVVPQSRLAQLVSSLRSIDCRRISVRFLIVNDEAGMYHLSGSNSGIKSLGFAVSQYFPARFLSTTLVFHGQKKRNIQLHGILYPPA